jgi:hypothetical protein
MDMGDRLCRIAMRHKTCEKLVISLAMCAGLGLTAATNARAADAPISDEARMHFKAGVNYLQDPDGARFEDAYTEFKTAYDLSHSPKILGNIGYCAMKLERDSEAIDAYTNYLKLVADIPAEERTQIQTDLYTLTASAATIAVHLSSAHENLSDARLRDTRYSTRGNITNIYASSPGVFIVTVRAGHHALDVMMGGVVRSHWEFDADGGARLSHDFVIQEPVVAQVAQVGRPSKTLPWITVGLGAAGLATGAVAGILAIARERSLEGECPMNSCPAGSNGASDISAANTFGTVADIALIGGGVVAVTGIIWLIASGSRTAPPATTAVAFGMGGCTGRGCYGTLHVDF